MIAITEDAAVLIRSLIGGAELGAGSGLRMSIDRARPGRGSLRMSLTAGPGTTDRVLDHHGVRVFLDPAAADRLRAHPRRAGHRPARVLPARPLTPASPGWARRERSARPGRPGQVRWGWSVGPRRPAGLEELPW